MLTLHIANKNYSSWSLRPWVLLQELSIPFEEVLSPFSEGSSWEEFRSFSPTGLVPCLVDGEQVVWDSLAITEYLAETHPDVWPSSKPNRTWARCAAAEMHSGFFSLRNLCSMNCGVRLKLHEIPVSLQQDLNRLDELWQQGLDQFGGPFLAGEKFTAADAFYAPVAFRVNSFDLPLNDTSRAYVQRLLDLPSMQDWYQSAIKETWREVAHDEETFNSGVLLEDVRAT